MTWSSSPGTGAAVSWNSAGLPESGAEGAIRRPVRSGTCGFDAGDDAVVAECRLGFDLPEPGAGQHVRQLPARVLPAIRAPDKHRDVQAGPGSERSRLVVVEQHLMHHDAAARRQAVEALAGEQGALFSRPVVVDVGVEMQVG